MTSKRKFMLLLAVLSFTILVAQAQKKSKSTKKPTEEPPVNATISPVVFKALDEVLESLDDIRNRNQDGVLTQLFELDPSGPEPLSARPRQRTRNVNGYKVSMFYTPINQ